MALSGLTVPLLPKPRLADSSGHGDCVKSSSVAILVSASATAKGVESSLRRSQEAPPERPSRLVVGVCHYGDSKKNCNGYNESSLL